MKIYNDDGKQTPEGTAFAVAARRALLPLWDQALANGANVRELAHVLTWEINDMELSSFLTAQFEKAKQPKEQEHGTFIVELEPSREVTVPVRNGEYGRNWQGGTYVLTEKSIATAKRAWDNLHHIDAIRTIRNDNRIPLKEAKDIAQFLFDQANEIEENS